MHWCALEMHNSCADPENSVRMEVPENFVLVTNVYKRGVRTSLEEQLDPYGPIASREGSVPVFLRKYIYLCLFSYALLCVQSGFAIIMKRKR